ncbi:MAG TPA: SIS domain-containing protein, partial [Vicinamibacterales bacterium]|nr:SIS domain-containing protein [Vicinamibacterales bacterium]
MIDSSNRAARVEERLRQAAAAHERMAARGAEAIVKAADAIVAAFERDGAVLVFGNGGSAAEAQHFVAELVGRYETERPGRRAIALTTDTSVLTAASNDYGFDRVFARQIEALGRRGDV